MIVSRINIAFSADLLKVDVSNEGVPEHKHFTEYGPGFEMKIKPSNKRNENDSLYLDSVINSVNKNLDSIK